MSAPRVGPELPPHLLAKRKRQAEEAEAKAAATTTKHDLQNHSRSPSPDSANKRRRVIGPAAPPAPLSERPPGDANHHGDSSSEDEFGPTLPNEDLKFDGEKHTKWDHIPVQSPSVDLAEKPSQRDEWMMLPPKQDDLAARMDPTKIRARGFNTGKGARGPSQAGGADNAVWTETPEQKRKRLEDEVLGVVRPTSTHKEVGKSRRDMEEDEEKARRIREYNDRHRSKTLYEEHQGSAKKEKEDDPSKRAFDYEKDMVAGSKIGHAQKREMLNRAANFGSRFSSGSYL